MSFISDPFFICSCDPSGNFNRSLIHSNESIFHIRDVANIYLPGFFFISWFIHSISSREKEDSTNLAFSSPQFPQYSNLPAGDQSSMDISSDLVSFLENVNLVPIFLGAPLKDSNGLKEQSKYSSTFTFHIIIIQAKFSRNYFWKPIGIPKSASVDKEVTIYNTKFYSMWKY